MANFQKTGKYFEGIGGPANRKAPFGTYYLDTLTNTYYIQSSIDSLTGWKKENVGDADDIAEGQIPAGVPRWNEVLSADNKALQNTAYVVDRIEGIGVNAALLFENGDGSGLNLPYEANVKPGLVFESRSNLDGGYMGLFWTVDDSDNDVIYGQEFAGVAILENYAALVGAEYNTAIELYGDSGDGFGGGYILYNNSRSFAVFGDTSPLQYNEGYNFITYTNFTESRLLQAVCMGAGEGTAKLGDTGDLAHAYGIVSLASASILAYNDLAGGYVPTNYLNGVSAISSKVITFGKGTDPTDATQFHPQYVSAISSYLTTIKGGSNVDPGNPSMNYSFVGGSINGTLDKAVYSAILTSQNSTIDGASDKASIVSSFGTTLTGVTNSGSIASSSSTLTNTQFSTEISTLFSTMGIGTFHSASIACDASAFNGSSFNVGIASSSLTVDSSATHIAAIGTSSFNSANFWNGDSVVRNYSLIANNLYANTVNLEIKTVAPTTPQEGEMWLQDDGVNTLSLYVRKNGVNLAFAGVTY